jgi:uncharacterized protein YciI
MAKNLLLFSFILLSWLLGCAPGKTKPAAATADGAALYRQLADTSAVYDETFARLTSADAIGMRRYVVAFLKRGPNRSQDVATAQALQKAHMENIGRMAAAGKLVLAGPFLDDGELRGIYVFNVETVEEARALTESDPAVKAGPLVMELHPWYGSAGLVLLNNLHKRLQKPG